MTLKERREAAGLRQIDVAERLEVDQSAISKWEQGENPPLKKYRVKLAELYGCDVEELLNHAGNYERR